MSEKKCTPPNNEIYKHDSSEKTHHDHNDKKAKRGNCCDTFYENCRHRKTDGIYPLLRYIELCYPSFDFWWKGCPTTDCCKHCMHRIKEERMRQRTSSDNGVVKKNDKQLQKACDASENDVRTEEKMVDQKHEMKIDGKDKTIHNQDEPEVLKVKEPILEAQKPAKDEMQEICKCPHRRSCEFNHLQKPKK